MRISILNLVLLFFTIGLCGQNNNSFLAIDYSHTTYFKNMPQAQTVNAYLSSNHVASVYEMDYNGKIKDNSEESTSDGQISFTVKSTKNPVIYKDLNKQMIFSTERISFKPVHVEDSINVFSWVLKNQFKEILNYKCQKAIMTHRGRDYEAYFTPELNHNVGPWKFDGLPGVILEVYSLDGVFRIEANKIDLSNEKVNIPLDFKIKDAVTWQEFVKKYTKKYNQLLSYTDENGGSMSIPKMKLELIVQD